MQEEPEVAERPLGFQLEGSPVRSWPFPGQFLALLFLADFLQWCVHNLLHRVAWLWTFHKVHHSITTMDWIGNWRFHWMEIVVYKSLLWLPLAWLDASPEAVMAVAVVTTVWGDFNHANLDVGLGPLGYLLNGPRMHLWHHDQSSEGGAAKNFGIVFSAWDFMFGTAYWPRARSPESLGYPGMEEMPPSFHGQALWPATRVVEHHLASRRAADGARPAGEAQGQEQGRGGAAGSAPSSRRHRARGPAGGLP